MITGCNTIADEVASQKIGMVYTGGDPNYVESPYSYKSIVDFEDNMISIRNVWNGGVEGVHISRRSTRSLRPRCPMPSTMPFPLSGPSLNRSLKITAMTMPGRQSRQSRYLTIA